LDVGTTVPRAFGADLGYLAPQDVQRLMASLVGLGAEVFMLKAEVERLRRALEATGAVASAQLDAAGSSTQFSAWLESEQAAFARSLLDPLWRAAAPATAPSAGGAAAAGPASDAPSGGRT
jgi:hypothetical protein